MCPHYRGVSSLLGCILTASVLTTGVCPHYWGVFSLQVSLLQGCVLTTAWGVFSLQVSLLQGCVLTTGVYSHCKCPYYRSVLNIYRFHMDAVKQVEPGRFKSGLTCFRPDFRSHGDNKIRMLCKYLIPENGDVGILFVFICCGIVCMRFKARRRQLRVRYMTRRAVMNRYKFRGSTDFVNCSFLAFLFARRSFTCQASRIIWIKPRSP